MAALAGDDVVVGAAALAGDDVVVVVAVVVVGAPVVEGVVVVEAPDVVDGQWDERSLNTGTTKTAISLKLAGLKKSPAVEETGT